MDKLILAGMEFWGSHGVLPEERRSKQPFLVDAVLYVDTGPAAGTDRIEDTVDYAAVYETARRVVEGTQVNLVETLAENLARRIMQEHRVRAVEITVRKPRAPMPGPVEYVGVTIYREVQRDTEKSEHTMKACDIRGRLFCVELQCDTEEPSPCVSDASSDTRLHGKELVYLGLGSNMGDKCGNLKEAKRLLEEDGRITVVKESSFYLTDPWGKRDQDQFVNQVLAVATDLDPRELLRQILAIEERMGRVRGEKWGPRIIDIDILLFGDREISTAELTVPHPRLKERAFVLVPLLEVDPDAVLPDGKRIQTVWENLAKKHETGCIKKLSCDKMSQRNIKNG